MEMTYGEDFTVWSNFIKTSNERSIFVYIDFLNSLGVKYELVTCKEDNEILAGAVTLFDDNGPIKKVFPFTEYQGILLANNSELLTHSRQSHEFKILEFFIAACTRHYKQLCFCQSWRFNDMRPFQWYNYHEPEKGLYGIDLRYTAILDLNKYSNFESTLDSARKVRRQEIRKAESTLKIEEIDDPDILEELHKKTFERQGLKRDENESFLVKSITESALKNGYGRLTCVKINGVPVAANLFIFDDRTGFYLFGANDPEYRNTFAGTYLLANAIENAKLRGLAEVDFVGANSPNRGDFKLSFNPELKPYFVASFPFFTTDKK